MMTPVLHRCAVVGLVLVVGCAVFYLLTSTRSELPEGHYLTRLMSNPLIVTHSVLDDAAVRRMSDPATLSDINKLMHRPTEFSHTNLSGPGLNGHYSQFNQSGYLDQLFARKTHGFYIECGAFDGEDLSNSLFFELKRNWSGLLVEADSANFRRLLSKQRRAYAINTCLSPATQPIELTFVNDGYGGYLADDDATKQKSTETMLCYPLYSVLLAIQQTHIDFFSLDIEGAELAVLRTIPLDKVYIDVFIVEFFVGGRGNVMSRDDAISQLDAFFTDSKLYKRIARLTIDVIYKHL